MNLKIMSIGITLMILCGGLLSTAKINNNYPEILKEVHFHSYNELTDLLGQLQLDYPEIFNYSSLGKTWEDKDIWLVKISDNVHVEEDEPGVLFVGGMHGDEKQGYEVVIYTIKALLENYTGPVVNQSFTERVRNVVNNTQLFFFPMLNPDGIEAGTRKNARPNDCPFGNTLFRGVDINRNSGYKWELQDEHPFRYRRSFPFIEKKNIKYPIFDFRSIIGEGCYRGPYPFSEPESMALRQAIEKHNISLYLDYHASAYHILYGWGWNHNHPIPNGPIMSSIAKGISDITGYIAKKGSSISTELGLMSDWMLGEHGILAFVIELPPVKGNKPLVDIIHGNSNPFKNVPILDMCKTHFLVNIYVSERAMLLG